MSSSSSTKVATLVSIVGGGLASLVLLWNIASSVTTVSNHVQENTQILKGRTIWFTSFEAKVQKLIDFNKEVMVVKYVNDKYVVVQVRTPEGKRYLKLAFYEDVTEEQMSEVMNNEH